MFLKLIKSWIGIQRGSSTAMTACSLATLMFTGGIVVDLGSYYAQVAKMQNAADAAAAAGISVHAENGTTRLIPVSGSIGEDGSFTYTLDGQEFSFKPIESEEKKESSDSLAEHYTAKNVTTSTENSTMQTTLWEDKSTTTLANGSKYSYTNAYAYRVDLSDNVDLHFSKFLGMDSSPAKVSALAIFVAEPDEDNIEEFIEDVSKNIYNTVPNFYWEAINYGDKNTINIASSDSTNTSNSFTEKPDKSKLGNKNPAYFTTTYDDYLKNGFVTVEDISQEEMNMWKRVSNVSSKNGDILGYQYTSESLEKKWCADPILGTLTGDNKAQKMIYTLNNKFILHTASSEITGLFIDRMNVLHKLSYNGKDWLGRNIRFIELNITGENISNDNTVPLYMRFESEPVMVSNHRAITQPIRINVKGVQKKPLVIAYDGPDFGRTLSDAPTINTATGYIDNNRSHETNYKDSSTITPAPYVLNLEKDFNGVIYAPFSRITVMGSGKIIGFVMAREIIDSSSAPSTRKTLTAEKITLPTWSRNGSHYSYTVTSIEGSYTVIYDDFYNYTKIKSGF